MIKHIILSTAFVVGCATTSQTLRPHPAVSPPNNSTIDMTVYNPPAIPTDMRSIRIRTYNYPPATESAIAPIEQNHPVSPTFNGVCLNEPAQATIESDINTTLRTGELNRFTAVGILGATAIRDISIARNDAEIQRVFFEAQIRDRDDQVTAANQIIRNLESNTSYGTLNVLKTVGWIAGGFMVGIAASGIYLLLTH